MSSEKKREGAFEQLGDTLGGMAGRMAGRATDMAMDVAGSVLGPVLESMGDWWASSDARSAADSFGEREERECRTHHESRRGASTGSGTAARDYESARPVYRFGHLAGQNPDYQGRSFDEVEPELENVWEKAGRDRFGDWPEVRSEVEFGYRIRSGAD
jgi:hypothetical protein